MDKLTNGCKKKKQTPYFGTVVYKELFLRNLVIGAFQCTCPFLLLLLFPFFHTDDN